MSSKLFYSISSDNIVNDSAKVSVIGIEKMVQG